ncbi:hypothetical protein HC931_24995 [Candidatus Gracilibacteria bacterium]|nr:hypothetical protein [Candidatus Gracilibacteria bacterium]NJM89613.1 hypothetical protein [Hydrococcus sp. RU_2_2]NJP21503.1 hypothetical protein [Hydrococcus sp. CRU_1_1]NJQ97972.1 hypothetical protein [Hydrococcus sp. CSU_1_8]
MNSSENRSSESHRPSDKLSSEIAKPPVRPIPPSPPVKPAPTAEVEDSAAVERNEPIPPPSHPRQYRAIGLIRGQYKRSEEQMTRGTLITSDGTEIEAVLLGRVISLLKNHLDLEQPHLWVVYPRTRQQDDCLHIQIVGVWEPETLNKETSPTPEPSPEATSIKTESGYFSIRGEVVYYSQDKKTIIVKIRQSPKREDERPKFFKLKLEGDLSDRPVGHFWDLQAQLQADNLFVREATDLGQLFKKKPFSRKPMKGRPERSERSDRPQRPDRPARRNTASGSPEAPQKPSPAEDKPLGGRVIPKPTQKKK